MKRYITGSSSIWNRIPKKYRDHILTFDIELSNDYNNRGQRLYNYLVEFDCDPEPHVFQNQDYMIEWMKDNLNV